MKDDYNGLELSKIYEENKFLLKDEGSFLKWINEHLSVILYELKISKTKKEREVICVDLYKIQKIIFKKIKRYYNKKDKSK